MAVEPKKVMMQSRRITSVTPTEAAEAAIAKANGERDERLAKAKLARAMITWYGMSKDFDMVAMETVTNQYLGGDATLACSTETQTKIDQEVVEVVKKQHEKAIRILAENRTKLDELSRFLYEKETITGDEFMEILNQ